MKLTHRAAVVPVAAVVSVLAAFTFAAPAGGAPVTAVPSVKGDGHRRGGGPGRWRWRSTPWPTPFMWQTPMAIRCRW